MSAGWTNSAGLFLNLAGVVALFRYGMPFQVRTGGITLLAIEQVVEKTIVRERRSDRYGYCALAAIVIETATQIAASFPQLVDP